MKKYTKIALIIAFCCIGGGLLLAIPFMNHMGMDGASISIPGRVSGDTIKKSMPIHDEINSIYIDDISCDVQILPSTDGQCRIDYTDNDQYSHQIEFNNGDLFIEVKDTNDFSNIFITVQGEGYVNIYLTECALKKLGIETISGHIDVASNISVQEAKLSSISGNILCNALVQHKLDADSISGDIKIDSVSTCTVNAATTSGNICVENLSPSELNVSTTSADLQLKNILVEGSMELDTTSGNIELHEVDAHSAYIDTAIGDVEGTVLSAKHFTTSTVSGSIHVSDTYNADETWDISTVSGDIEIEILQ